MSLLLLFHGSTDAGAMIGATTITFSQTGTLGGSGALAGSSTVTFSQSGVLRGAGALAGSTTVLFSQTGTLLGVGSLIGSTTIVLSVIGSVYNFIPNQNADGLVIFYGTDEGTSFPLSSRPLDYDPPGKLIYGRSKRHGYRK